MAVLLALLTSLLYGTSDFVAGVVGKRMKVLQLLAASHTIGLASITVISLLIANVFSWSALGWGALGGAFGAVGLGLLYRGLARGPMGVVAPLTAVTSAAVPGLWGVVVDGDVLSVRAWIGLALAFVAIILVSAAPSESDAGVAVTLPAIAEALTGGVGFGLMFVTLAQADGASLPWPVVGARILTVVVLGGWLLARRRPVMPRGRVLTLQVGVVGLLDTLANATFLWAEDRGSLTVVAVLGALYPVATVVLARMVLGERLMRSQQAGFLVATIGTGLIAAG